MGIYQALRAQRVLKAGDYAPWEQALAAGLAAMHGLDHPWVAFLMQHYGLDSSLLCVMKHRGDEGFPYHDWVSPRMVTDTNPGPGGSAPYDRADWLREQGSAGLAWLRIRQGYEAVLKEQMMGQGWPEPCIYTLQHAASLQAWSMPLGLALSELQGYKEGWFEMQDLSCQRLLECMPQTASGRWLDACAGSGGKALLLHESHPEIQWFVTDSRESILQELSRRFQRVGWRNYSRACVDWLRPEPAELGSFPAQFDGILLDAPCSGSGSWRNHPHLQLLGPGMSPQDFAVNQSLMLRRLWSRVRPGGHLLYATCSAYACENEEIVQTFVREQQDANLLLDRYLNASPQGGDTMYAALMCKAQP